MVQSHPSVPYHDRYYILENIACNMSIKLLFKKYGCDKAVRHKYHLVYDKILADYDSPKILEIGVLKGNSTLAFIEYKPNSTIVGIDVFTRHSKKIVEDRFTRRNLNVKLYECDSTNESAVTDLMTKLDEKYDIIIDDAAHFPDSNKKTLRNFMPYLADNGIYVIEDIFPINIMDIEEFEHPWIVRHPIEFSYEEYNDFLQEVNRYKNVVHYDHRAIGQPDSYIITIQK